MKKIFVLVTAVSLFIMTSAIYAAENDHGSKTAMNSSMQKDEAMTQGDMKMMKMNMQEMMKQMNDIHATSDPEKRKQLMHEHMQSMHEGMQMMRNMGGGMMMGMMSDNKGGHDMMKEGMGKSMGSDMERRNQMMEQRMDMMQMMMEQMMQQMMAQENVAPKMKKKHDHREYK